MTASRTFKELPATYQRTDDLVEMLQDFVSARFADLTAATGLTDRARQVLNAVNSAASSVRGTPSTAPVASPRRGHVVVGHHLPLIRPGLERC
jgi:hypothetical protein